MKKISILFYLVFSLVTFTSCEQQDEIRALDASESEISIDQKSQIILQSATLSKEEIAKKSCGETKIIDLIAGQHDTVGNIEFSNDETNLYVTYNVAGDWMLKETHLYAGAYKNLPLNTSGNPQIGHFPYHGDHDLTNSYTFPPIPLDQLGADNEGCFIIAAHAVVVKVNNQTATASETAFGKDEFDSMKFPGKRWGWYLNYCEQTCDDLIDDFDDDEDDTKDGIDDNIDTMIEDDCYNAFAAGNEAYQDRSYCFTYTNTEDNTLSGWYNEFSFVEQQDKHYIHPLYAKVEQCNTDPATWVEIGYVDVYLFSEGSGDARELFCTVKYHITKEGYELNEANLYFSHNDDPNYINTFDGDYNYDRSSAYWVSETSSFENIPWPDAYYLGWGNYFVPNAKICKVTASN